MIISRSIHVAANGIISLFYGWVAFHCIRMSHLFLHSSVSGHLGCFYVLVIVSSVAVNIVVHVFFLIRAFSRLPRWHSDKESARQAGAAGDMGSIPGLGRSPGEENSNPLQYSCLENPMNRGACSVTVHRVAKSWTWLIDWACHWIYAQQWDYWIIW